MVELVTTDPWGAGKGTPTVFGGRFDVVEKIGDGGMATVYRATDRKLKRDVAIKVMHPHLSSRADARQRFEREARAAARLEHGNIVKVFDFSGGKDEHAFIVAEFVQGETLTSFVQAHGPFVPQTAALIVHAVAGALAHAHAAGIVHRDIKPDNLMISRDGQLKLMDFGIATGFDLDQMTVTGAIVGSPAHMAPEQIEGVAIDHRCDMFALGIVAYFLVTRRLPFQASNPHALFRMILEGAYEPAGRQVAAVDRTFEAIMSRCMQRRPEDRYANMAELQAALAGYLKQFRMSDVASLLLRFLKGPELFQHDLRDTLVQCWTAEGHRFAAAGQLAHAIDAFNRALVVNPDAEEPKLGLESLTQRSRRRRMARRTGVVFAATGATVVAVWGGARVLDEFTLAEPAAPQAAVAVAVPPAPDQALLARGEAVRVLSEQERALRQKVAEEQARLQLQEVERSKVAAAAASTAAPATEPVNASALKEADRRTAARKALVDRDWARLPGSTLATPVPGPSSNPGPAAMQVPVRIGSVDTTASLLMDGDAIGEGSVRRTLDAGRTYVVRCLPQASCGPACRPGQVQFTVPKDWGGTGTWIAPKCQVQRPTDGN
ncbi:MAG: serine/threonine protein kinase [Myxococcales bacterium]|nr:serine/threonine protein kinase [Myxococcales bacterium]